MNRWTLIAAIVGVFIGVLCADIWPKTPTMYVHDAKNSNIHSWYADRKVLIVKTNAEVCWGNNWEVQDWCIRVDEQGHVSPVAPYVMPFASVDKVLHIECVPGLIPAYPLPGAYDHSQRLDELLPKYDSIEILL